MNVAVPLKFTPPPIGDSGDNVRLTFPFQPSSSARRFFFRAHTFDSHKHTHSKNPKKIYRGIFKCYYYYYFFLKQ